MNAKSNGADDKDVRANTTTNVQSVRANSAQTQAPGAVAPGSANVQSANVEQGNAAQRDRGALQGAVADDAAGSDRGGAGAQQAGWSARQQADRNEARSDELRQGEPQQSGYGGLEQDQHAGSQESVTGPSSARQGGPGVSQQQDLRGTPSTDAGSRRTDRTPQR